MNQDKIKQLKQRIERTKDLLEPKPPYEFEKTAKKYTRSAIPKGKQHRCRSANDPTLRTQHLPAYVTAAHLSLSTEHLLILDKTRTTLFQLRTELSDHAKLFELLLSHAIVFLYARDSAVLQEFLLLLCDKDLKMFNKIYAIIQAKFVKDKQL